MHTWRFILSLAFNVLACAFAATSAYQGFWLGEDPFQALVLALLLGLTADNIKVED